MIKMSATLLVAALSLFKSGHSAIMYPQLCYDYLFAQDSGPNMRGTYLGYITSDGVSPGYTYLANMNKSSYQESIVNRFSKFGSEYSIFSILNEYWLFGGEHSNYSPFNDRALLPPIIWSKNDSTGLFTQMAYLSKNRSLNAPVTDPDTLLLLLRKTAMCGGKIIYPRTLTVPDLVVDSISATRSASGDSITIRYIVRNFGGTMSPAFSVSADVNGFAIPDHNFPSLNTDSYHSRNFIQKITHDTTSIALRIDSKNSIIEDSEDNNTSHRYSLTPINTSADFKKSKPLSKQASWKLFDALGRSSSINESTRIFTPAHFTSFPKRTPALIIDQLNIDFVSHNTVKSPVNGESTTNTME